MRSKAPVKVAGFERGLRPMGDDVCGGIATRGAVQGEGFGGDGLGQREKAALRVFQRDHGCARQVEDARIGRRAIQLPRRLDRQLNLAGDGYGDAV